MRNAATFLMLLAVALVVGCAESEEERTHDDAAIEFFEGLDDSGIFFSITAESSAPESLSSISGPCEHDPFGDDPRALLEEALTEEELAWVCEGCDPVYEALPSDVSFDGGVVYVQASLVECRT